MPVKKYTEHVEARQIAVRHRKSFKNTSKEERRNPLSWCAKKSRSNMTQDENAQASLSLRGILNLKWSPIAVKLVEEEKHPENMSPNSARKIRYCQLLMEAKKGRSASPTRENIACPAAAAALGFFPLAEKIKSGEMLKTLGLFDAREAAAATMAQMPRLEQ